MRRLSLYLHQDVLDTLKCFGNVNDVINNLIKASLTLEELYEQPLPTAPSKEHCKRINVFINDELYDELGFIKVRPLVYWFVENEIYDQLDWKMTNGYGEEKRIKLSKQFDRTIYELRRLNKLCNNVYDEFVDRLELERSRYEAE